MQHAEQSVFSKLTRYVRRAGLVAALMALAGCSVTGRGLSSTGLNKIVEGRTTIAQASLDLGAQPSDIWQQGDTTLARWSYLGSLAYNAVYVRQEVWLRFGPDGMFQRMEDSINIPPMDRPRTAAEADRQAGSVVPAPAVAQPDGNTIPAAIDPNLPAADGTITIPGNGPGAPGLNPAPTSRIAPLPSGSATTNPQPLLPAETKIVPGVTYPLPGKP